MTSVSGSREGDSCRLNFFSESKFKQIQNVKQSQGQGTSRSQAMYKQRYLGNRQRHEPEIRNVVTINSVAGNHKAWFGTLSV